MKNGDFFIMKNKKAIIILMVLILFSLIITGVSASDVNTTQEISASGTDDVASINNDLIDKSTNSDDSTILCSSTDENLTVQDNLDNGFKKNELTDFRGDNIDDTNNINSVSSKSEVLSVSDDNILSQEIINYNDILGDTKGSTTISATITSSNTVSVTFTNVYASISTERRLYVGYNNELKFISDVTASRIQEATTALPLYLVSGSGTVTFSSNVFSAGNSYTLRFYAVNEADGSYPSYSINGKTYHSGMNLILSPPKATPTVTVSTSSITYAALNQKVSGTVKSGSTNVNEGTVTIKYNGNSIGSGAVTNGNYDVSIDSTFANPSDSGYSITAEYSGSTSYNTASKSSTLKVNKITPTISVVSQSVYYGQTDMPTLSGTVYSTSGNYYSGTVDLYINNQLVKSGIAVSNAGSWSYTFTSLPDLNPGTYDVKIAYSGSTYANSKTETKSQIYTVNKNTPDISAGQNTISYGQSNDVIISGTIRNPNVSNVYGGTANITIGNMTWNDVVVNDDGSWTVPGFSSTLYTPDTYTISVVYSGNDYTMAKTAENAGTLTVNKGMLFVMATNTGNIDLGSNEIITLTVMNYARTALENISVKLTGDGIQNYLTNTTNSEGKLTFTVPGLTRGQYSNWELEITGNDYYEDYPFAYPISPFYVQSPLNVLITGISPNNTTFPEEIIVTGYTDADQIPQGIVGLTIGGKTYTGLFDSNGNFTAS